MKPDWDKLMETYAESSSVVIGDVDCTTDEAKSVCSDVGIRKFPSLVFFTDDTGKKGDLYLDDKSYDALNEFVKDRLIKKECDPEAGTCTEPTARRYGRKGRKGLSGLHGASKPHVDWFPR